MKCEVCGEEFHAVRFDAKYCSGRCRTAAYRGAIPFAQRPKAATDVTDNTRIAKLEAQVAQQAATIQELMDGIAAEGPGDAEDQPRRVLRLPDGTEHTFAANIADMEARIEELEEENKELLSDAVYNEDEVARGEMYDEGPEGLEEAHEKIRDLEDDLERQRRAAREARYTMPPKDLEELLYLAYEAAVHEPNWPKGRKQRCEMWRDTLVSSLLGLGFVHSAAADKETHWPEKRE